MAMVLPFGASDRLAIRARPSCLVRPLAAVQRARLTEAGSRDDTFPYGELSPRDAEPHLRCPIGPDPTGDPRSAGAGAGPLGHRTCAAAAGASPGGSQAPRRIGPGGAGDAQQARSHRLGAARP